MTFEKEFDAYRQQIEEAWTFLLPDKQTEPPLIHQAMRYCMEAGGKRLRPILVLAASDLFPKIVDPMPAAVAVELLHSYTLVHDDLPCMDDSPLRRGLPSAHVEFGEATAVLTGDALLTEAFSLISSGYADSPEIGLELVHVLSRAAGSRRLIGGQLVDTLSENVQLDKAGLDYVHRSKTADLINASIRMGLICSNTPEAVFDTANEIGMHMGLAFQIIDDILDATSDAETLGKTAGNDERKAKNTYVSLFGLEESRRQAALHTDLALENCRKLPVSSKFLMNLIESLLVRIR